jgi:fatty-acyl-CoA synthase
MSPRILFIPASRPCADQRSKWIRPSRRSSAPRAAPLGTIEADGRIRFCGRLKELIKTGGVNVAPLGVEQILLQHPDIVQAYVVGVPDRSKGEIVAAVIELRAGAATDPAAIVAFCREQLASYKVPARLAFRAAAPLARTPTGKIHKPSLVEQLAANSAR